LHLAGEVGDFQRHRVPHRFVPGFEIVLTGAMDGAGDHEEDHL
jgi:hypothetical protein